MKEHCGQFYAHKFDDLDEMDQFLKKHNLQKLTQEETDIVLYTHTLFSWALLYCVSQMLQCLQIEGKTLHQGPDYDLFYCHGLGTKPTTSLGYTYIESIFNSFSKQNSTKHLRKFFY